MSHDDYPDSKRNRTWPEQDGERLAPSHFQRRSRAAKRAMRESCGFRNRAGYRPDILDLVHQPDEYAGVDHVLDAAAVLAPALSELLEAA